MFTDDDAVVSMGAGGAGRTVIRGDALTPPFT